MRELVADLEKRADHLLRIMDALEEVCRTNKDLDTVLREDLKRNINRIYRQYCSINSLIVELSR